MNPSPDRQLMFGVACMLLICGVGLMLASLRDPKPIIIQYVGQRMSACDIPSDDPHHQAMGLTLGLQVRKGDAYTVVWLCPAHYKEWTGRTVTPYEDGFFKRQP